MPPSSKRDPEERRLLMHGEHGAYGEKLGIAMILHFDLYYLEVFYDVEGRRYFAPVPEG